MVEALTGGLWIVPPLAPRLNALERGMSRLFRQVGRRARSIDPWTWIMEAEIVGPGRVGCLVGNRLGAMNG